MCFEYRSYWKNYFESTDGVAWVVDSADARRLADCARELRALLCEERLAGATLLVLANKADLPGALSLQEIREVRQKHMFFVIYTYKLIYSKTNKCKSSLCAFSYMRKVDTTVSIVDVI